MGYYTIYSLNIIKDPNNEIEAFKNELSNYFTDTEVDYLFDGYLEAKWYDWSTNLEGISKKFPNMLFLLSGDGEEPLDIWNCYFCNGNSHYREIQTHWEEFDAEEFYTQNKS